MLSIKYTSAQLFWFMLSRLFSDSLSIDLPLKNGFGRLSFIIHNNYGDRSPKVYSSVERLAAFFENENKELLTWRTFNTFPEKPERVPTSSSAVRLALDRFSSLLRSTPVVCLFSSNLASARLTWRRPHASMCLYANKNQRRSYF